MVPKDQGVNSPASRAGYQLCWLTGGLHSSQGPLDLSMALDGADVFTMILYVLPLPAEQIEVIRHTLERTPRRLLQFTQ